MNEEKRPDKYLDYKLLDSIYGDDGELYGIYRKVVEKNGNLRGLWAAAPHVNDGSFDESKMFDITYAQASGFEPIAETDIGKLRRTLGKKLLPQQESYGRKVMNKRRLNERYPDYDPTEWKPEDIELHKSIDWKERNYEEYEVPEDSFVSNVVCYRRNASPEYKRVKFHKFIRPNPIFPPYYAPAEEPFDGVVGPMHDGRMRGKYGVHDRYEDQEIYDMLSESLKEGDESDIDTLKALIKRRKEIEDKIEKHGFKDSMNLKNEYDEIRTKIKALRRKIDRGGLPRLTGMSKSDELLKESVPAKAKKEIAGWWKEVEAWNKKKKEFNISNDYDDVEGMHTAMFDMLDELKSRDKDLYEKGRKIYNKYSDVPIKKKKVKESMSRNKKRLYKSLDKSLKESIWGRQSAYDPEEWEQEDIELHKSIDWQGRNYMDYEVPDDKFKANVVCYRSDREPEIKGVEFHKFLRPNPIYPPCYRPAEKPFTGVIGPMFDGHKRGKYGIHDRYEDQRIYDMLSESYEDEFDDDILEDEGAETVIGIDDNKYAKSSSKSVRDSDGFMTDYTAWIDLDNLGHVIFIFGDNDLYDPSNTSSDWECDNPEEAQEWFNNYEGFDEEEEDYYDFMSNL